MRPKERRESGQKDLFKARLDQSLSGEIMRDCIVFSA